MTPFTWRVADDILAPARGIMGIINLTADSFYDGGQYNQPELAIAHANKLLADGAAILDLGAESTRPGAQPVNPAVECERLAPVLKAFANQLSPPLLSIDTRNARTAEFCLSLGANIINDVSGLNHDPAMIDVLATLKPGYVLTHSQGEPQTMQKQPHYANVITELCVFFEHKLNLLTAKGLPEDHIVLDPGIGFGKTLEHNLIILRKIDEFMSFGRPILVGLSMKSLFGQLFHLAPHERGPITMTASALMQVKGVQWHRVHNVSGVRQALELAEILLR